MNIRRVAERVRGTLAERAAEDATVRIGRPLRGRDRLLALMDLGAIVCTAREPALRPVPDRARRCATRGPLADETQHRQARVRGLVPAAPRRW